MTLDIDGNGRVGPLSGGLLLFRYFFGFTGDSLINGIVELDCTRCNAEDIEAYLAQL